MSTIILILTLFSCISAIITVFLKKDFNVLQKINAVIYLFFVTAFISLLSSVINYLKTSFVVDYSYIDILNSLFMLTTFIGAVIITVGNFYKNKNFQKYAYRLYDIGIVVFAVIMTINILYSNYSFKYMLAVLILSSALNISMMINSSENLKSLASKSIYFISNFLLGVFWLVCIVTFFNRLTNISSNVVIFIIMTLILSFNGLVFGLITVKKESSKQ